MFVGSRVKVKDENLQLFLFSVALIRQAWHVVWVNWDVWFIWKSFCSNSFFTLQKVLASFTQLALCLILLNKTLFSLNARTLLSAYREDKLDVIFDFFPFVYEPCGRLSMHSATADSSFYKMACVLEAWYIIISHSSIDRGRCLIVN